MSFRNNLLVVIHILVSCNDTGQLKFDKTKWNTKDDNEFTYRNKMITDLTTNYKLVGLKYREIRVLLGETDYRDTISFGYSLFEDFGSDIDPFHSKNLDFKFDKDSKITSFNIEEWKK